MIALADVFALAKVLGGTSVEGVEPNAAVDELQRDAAARMDRLLGG